MEPLWGIDLGGTKIEGIILDGRENPQVLQRLRVPTEARKGYHHIIQQICNLVELMAAETGLKPSRIGIGMPGTIDPGNRLAKNSNTTCINGKAFFRDVQRALGTPITMANDANCFAVAETVMGSVTNLKEKPNVVFGIIMGTGVGGGVVVDGRALVGRHAIAGEWGHMTIEPGGNLCYCGRRGCVETYLSGPWTQRYYHSITDEEVTMQDIIQRYREGDDVGAQKTMKRLFHYFGRAIGNVINVLDPDVIVLGGGLSNIEELYVEGVAEVEKNIFNHELTTKFLKPALGDSAGVFGAALL